MRTLVAPDLVEQFSRDGFVVVPDLLTDDELSQYGEAVDARRGRPATRRSRAHWSRRAATSSRSSSA